MSMTDCRATQNLLPLWAGGDLDAVAAAKVLRHMEACPVCSDQAAEFLQVKALGREIYQGDEGLPDAVRGRLTRLAASTVRSRGWFRDLVGAPLGLAPRPALALATLAAAFVLLISLSLMQRGPGESRVVRSEDPILLDVAYNGEAVRLAWTDGKRDRYRVYKSDDPRGLTGVRPRIVEGSTWVDDAPDTSPIVYYRIESR